jgi:hypothetical protein
VGDGAHDAYLESPSSCMFTGKRLASHILYEKLKDTKILKGKPKGNLPQVTDKPYHIMLYEILLA